MKIDGVRGVGQAAPAQRSGGAAAPRFSPVSGPERASAANAVSPTPALDAVLALQGGAEPDRRHRQARRGRRLLDALDRLTRALLEGIAPAGLRSELDSLKGQSQPTGDTGLDDILREIDTRAAVELAKLEAISAPA